MNTTERLHYLWDAFKDLLPMNLLSFAAIYANVNSAYDTLVAHQDAITMFITWTVGLTAGAVNIRKFYLSWTGKTNKDKKDALHE